MNIGKNTVVSIEYTLKNDQGEVLDSAETKEPLIYMQGVGNLIPGLEKVLEGKTVGDAVEVKLTPEEGYGQRDESLIRNLPLRKLAEKKPQVGGRYRAQTDQGVRFVLVKSISGDYALIDPNHPLAGLNLHFAVKVVSLREPTKEEIEHGHVHGEGAHNH